MNLFWKKKKKKTEKKKYYARKFNTSCETPYQLFFNKQNEFPIIRGALDEPVPFLLIKLNDISW